MNFIPEKPRVLAAHVPYFEDIQASEVRGYSVTKPQKYYQNNITELLIELGAMGVMFQAGTFPTVPERFGYQIKFHLGGIPGRIDCAALPIRSYKDHKKDRALAQALYLVQEWLKAEIDTKVYRPGAIPLMPYLIGAGGKTVTEELIEHLQLPEFNVPKRSEEHTSEL